MAEVDPKIVAEEAKKANSKKDPLFPFPFLLNATTTTAAITTDAAAAPAPATNY